jgi:serine/threonine-protein kinase
LDDMVVKLMAKAPADRPWDAAVVEHVFKDLRERAERGDAIDMVWPSLGSAAANPARAGVGAPAPRPRKKTRKSGTLGGYSSGFATRDPGGGSGSFPLSRGTLEVAGLLAALLVIGGFIGYWLWPPSAQYLYRQAEALMASEKRSDRLTARDEYLDALDRRFPDHPYKEQTQKWRDRIWLEEAEGRAKTLSSPVKNPLTEPQNDAERKYVAYDSLAAKAAEAGNEVKAAMYWREMARLINAADPEERKWHLLAVKRADDLETKIRERRAHVIEMLERAEAAFQAGRPNEALAIRASLAETYGRFTELADLLGSPPASPPPARGTGPAEPGGTRPAPAPPHRGPGAAAGQEPDPARQPPKAPDGP